MNKNEYSQTPDNTFTRIPEAVRDGDFEAASGTIPYNLTNDYMFRAVFQSSNKALRGLLCSLLHLADSEVHSVEVTNPILLGERIDSKAFHLDIHLLLNDSLTLYVADLTRIDLATQEDRQYHIDSWARLMKAKTWEELRMTAEEDEALYEAAKALFYNSSEEEIRLRCLDREEYYQDLRNYERVIAEKEAAMKQDHIAYEEDIRAHQRIIAEKEAAIAQNQETIHAHQRIIAEQNSEIAQLRAEIERMKNKL